MVLGIRPGYCIPAVYYVAPSYEFNNKIKNCFDDLYVALFPNLPDSGTVPYK